MRDDDEDSLDGGGRGGRGGADEREPHEPTAPERSLPWKRTNEEADMCPAPLRQREFPGWLKNEEYMVHGTPTQEMMQEMGESASRENNDTPVRCLYNRGSQPMGQK